MEASDALRNAIQYMTLEEIRQTLWRTLGWLAELYGDRTNAEDFLPATINLNT